MHAKFFLPFMGISLLIASCTQPNQNHEALDIQSVEIGPPPAPASPPGNRSPEQKLNLKSGDSLPPSPTLQTASRDWDKKIIKTAQLKLEVADHKKFNGQLHNLIRQSGAYVAEETQQTTEERLETTVAIKVPVAEFETLMNQLGNSEAKVLERRISSQDVSEEVIDTRSRLEAKREVRLKYLDFLKASKNMDDVLKVQAEINEIQESIEAATGRIEYLSHQAALSTINLSYAQPFIASVPANDPPTFASRIFESFESGATWFADVFIGLVSIWPLLLIITAVIVIYRNRFSIAGERRKL